MSIDSDYQVKSPQLCQNYVQEMNNNDEMLLKSSDDLTDEELDNYLAITESLKVAKDKALFTLLKCNYDMNEAIQMIKQKLYSKN